MCVLALAWESHPRWRLVLAGNRDERHDRPAAPLQRWNGHPGVLAGRDLISGGTWLGVAEAGRLAVVTNLRGYGAPDPRRPSRGLLLSDFLTGEGRYAHPTKDDIAAFNPFNLITLDHAGLASWTNQPAPGRQDLSAGIYGLSNGALDAPWPKTVQLKAHLEDWLAAAAEPEALLAALAEDHLPAAAGAAAPPSDTPQQPPVSPIFARNPVYGTRCSTVIVIDHERRGHIVERRYDAQGVATGETALGFAWTQAAPPLS